MSTGICKSPGSRYWRALYKAALSEIGNSKLPERIAEVEKAVVKTPPLKDCMSARFHAASLAF